MPKMIFLGCRGGILALRIAQETLRILLGMKSPKLFAFILNSLLNKLQTLKITREDFRQKDPGSSLNFGGVAVKLSLYFGLRAVEKR